MDDWYASDLFSYIRIWDGNTVHMLPRIVPDRLVLEEVAFQTVTDGSYKTLVGLLKPQLCLWLIRVSTDCNTRRKPSQRLQTIPHRYCSILDLFKVVISHGYYSIPRWPSRVRSTEDLFPKLENNIGGKKEKKNQI